MVFGCTAFNLGLSCTPSGYPAFVDQSLLQQTDNLTLLISPTTLFLIPDYEFACEGKVVLWELYATGNGSQPVEFSVWRSELSTYRLIGSNYFTGVAPPDGSNLLSYPVSTEDQIEVKPGDIAGIRSIVVADSAEPSPLQIQCDPDEENRILFYSLNSSTVTPQTLSVPSLQQDNGVPILRVSVECK